jgi:hypothetical protein
MTIEKVYDSLSSFLLSLLPNDEWFKAELSVKIQPKMVGMSGKCYTSTKELSLRTKFDDALEAKIKWLHVTTTKGGQNKWNKAKFTITSDNQFHSSFIWDQEWQNEVDMYNKQEAERDINYRPPRWHWDEQENLKSE